MTFLKRHLKPAFILIASRGRYLWLLMGLWAQSLCFGFCLSQIAVLLMVSKHLDAENAHKPVGDVMVNTFYAAYGTNLGAMVEQEQDKAGQLQS